MQKEIENKDKKWVKVGEQEHKDDADVVKLDVGECIEGLLLQKKNSTLFGYVYKLKVKEDDRFKILCGTTVLNTKFANIPENVEVKVERLKDSKSQTGRVYQDYDVYFIE